ncbi:MAG: hypothetical protein KDD70_17975, partial [Bdellovibrionales bacterium]|nr:hypothetical protein [Bdellovibrionales bacterium]
MKTHKRRRAGPASSCLIFISLLSLSFNVLAQGGGGHEEGAGNNLSFPTIFAEGIGITGDDVTISHGLRQPPVPPGYQLEGEFLYGWLDNGVQMLCEPQLPHCPPPAEPDVYKIYLQDDQLNSWQADWLDGRGSVVEVSSIDWGDNLENQTWTDDSIVRVEVALYKELLTPILGDEMWYVSGQGIDEMWGMKAVEAPSVVPPTWIPATYESSEATVYSPCSRLTIQKMDASAGDVDNKPQGPFAWNAANNQWDGMVATMVNAPVWESYEAEGPSAGLSAEVNIKGSLIYGYIWQIPQMVFQQGIAKTGWYRLTFSLDGTEPGGTACGNFTLNTSVAAAQVRVAEEGVTEEAAPPQGYDAVVDATNNLTYLDIFIRKKTTSGNTPPLCDAGSTYSQNCTGVTTNVFLSGANSYDAENELGFIWSNDCEQAAFNDSTVENPVLGLLQPGLGEAQDCQVTLTVKELGVLEPLTDTCSAPISVTACSLDCFDEPLGLATLDECGVCDGNNECFDCLGIPFGTARVDRCGVCSGDGTSCLNCVSFNQSNTLAAMG